MIAFHFLMPGLKLIRPELKHIVSKIKDLKGGVSSGKTMEDLAMAMNLEMADICYRSKIYNKYHVSFESWKKKKDDSDYGAFRLIEIIGGKEYLIIQVTWHELRSIIGRNEKGDIIIDPSIQTMTERYPKNN